MSGVALALLLAAADPVVLEARIAAADRMLVHQRARLAAERLPLARLLARLQRAAAAGRDPAIDDEAAHARALYLALAPVVAARTVPIARALAATLADRDDATRRLRDAEADEIARLRQHAAAIATRLARLPAPLPAPGRLDSVSLGNPVYRMPSPGHVVSGTGERLETGVQARGLTLATASAARVAAPALGRIVYARRFRGYGGVVILDHGHGWTTLLAGLDRMTARAGGLVRQGGEVGTMPAVAPVLTVELRHHGVPLDVASMAAGGGGAQAPFPQGS